MEQNFNVEMDSVINKVNDFVEKYGKNNGYTFIFGKNRAGSVLYGTESKDITEAVTKAINEAYKKLIELGAIENEKPYNVGGEIMTATVKDPFGNIIGIIYNPEFKLEKQK